MGDSKKILWHILCFYFAEDLFQRRQHMTFKSIFRDNLKLLNNSSMDTFSILIIQNINNFLNRIIFERIKNEI